MHCSGRSALHGVNPNKTKNKKNKAALQKNVLE